VSADSNVKGHGVLGKLLLILVALVWISAMLEDLDRREEGYTPWRLATAQKMLDEDHIVHASRNGDGSVMAFETPLMTRRIALAVATAGNVASNAIKLGYRTFTFSNGTRTWTYDLQKNAIRP